jgi:predicted alpha/beta-fold hydrolase
MARRFLAAIRIPTLVIHARDDPWIPSEMYTSYEWSGNPKLRPLLAKGGGHVGFHGQGGGLPWHDRCLLPFFDALSG